MRILRTANQIQTAAIFRGTTNFRAILCCLTLAVLACCSVQVRANTNFVDFNYDDKADLLFYNKTTGVCYLWFMNGTSFVSSAPITYAGAPVANSDKEWKVVGAGYFDSAQPTTRLGILWQHLTQQTLAVWYLNNTDRTILDSGVALNDVPGTDWKATAVGNFDGTGTSDIAFENITTGQKAIWLMNGTSISSAGVIPGTGSAHLDYRITAAGDFGSASSPTSGVKDGIFDILLTHYNPATDVYVPGGGENYCVIWFMNGFNIQGGAAISDANEIIQKLDNPDWRVLACGDFDLDGGGNGKTDIWHRHATIGQHSTWSLSGYRFLGGAYTKPEPDPALKLFSQDWLQSTWRHKDLYPSLTASPSASSVTLNYRIKPYQSFGVTVRRRVAGGSWNTLASGVSTDAQGSGSYVDPFSPTPGTSYEYEVFRDGNPETNSQGHRNYFPARVMTGINFPISSMEQRGKVVVIVDGSVAPNIGTGLNTFTNNLIGDGWTVATKLDGPRHDGGSAACTTNTSRTTSAADTVNKNNREALKLWIRNNHSDAKGIILVGHVTVPFSGGPTPAPDGHEDHRSAWVADLWYGDLGLESAWTDTTNFVDCVRFPHNYNEAGDGKFDNYYAPSGLTMFVGRIDFARLPVFGTGDSTDPDEFALLNRYFTKNNDYRNKLTEFNGRGIVLGAFNILEWPPSVSASGVNNLTVYENAFRNLGPQYGTGFGNVVIGDPYHQKSDAYLWGFLGGWGTPTLINQGMPSGHPDPAIGLFLEHSTTNLLSSEAKIGFYVLTGSYFGDWYLQDDFMRATLATTNYGLAAVWMSVNPSPDKGGTHWQFHPVAVGDVLGTAQTQTINQGRPLTTDDEVVVSILGDPTLRSSVIAPVQITSASKSGTSVSLSWNAGESGCQYYIYEAPSQGGPYSRVVGPISSTSHTFTAQGGSTAFMVRASKNVTTGSATYENLSQGAFYWP